MRAHPSLLGVALVAFGCGASASPQPVAAPCPACPSVPAATASAATVAPSLVQVRDLVIARLDAGDGQGLFDLYGPGMRQAFPVEQTKGFAAAVLATHGKSHPPPPEARGEAAPDGGEWIVHAEKHDYRLRLGIDDKGLIEGLLVASAPEPDPPVARSNVPLGLPFHGEWLVVWGGDRSEVNEHVDAPSQRRAADLVMAGPDGKTYRTDGKTNKDYLAYGQEVLAVADGTVAIVVDGVPENEPAEMNEMVLPGNYLVVRHTGTLHSLYAHLQPASIRVKSGAKVKRGQVLGLCGNSGNSSEPHLHFQLQDGPAIERSWGVEAVFADAKVTRAGRAETMHDYTFLKDDRVKAP
jgi:peptidase M23-like protein